LAPTEQPPLSPSPGCLSSSACARVCLGAGVVHH
jgi:hypothetical protein